MPIENTKFRCYFCLFQKLYNAYYYIRRPRQIIFFFSLMFTIMIYLLFTYYTHVIYYITSLSLSFKTLLDFYFVDLINNKIQLGITFLSDTHTLY